MSVWANFVGHFSSWQAARVEVKQDEQIDDTTEQVDKTEDKLNAINTAR
jgi:hypothetical protein